MLEENKLEEIYDNIIEAVKGRSKITWYEEGEKSSKFLLTNKMRNFEIRNPSF